jgi:anti-anti-sigma factor
MFTTISPVTLSARSSIDVRCPSPRTVRVAVVGEIDLSNSDVLRVRLLNVLSALHPDRIEVDLAGVTFLGCSGLTVLVALGQAAARTGCRLWITNPQPIVRRVLDLTGLLGVPTQASTRHRWWPPPQTGPCRRASCSPPGPKPSSPPTCPPVHRSWKGRSANYRPTSPDSDKDQPGKTDD